VPVGCSQLQLSSCIYIGAVSIDNHGMHGHTCMDTCSRELLDCMERGLVSTRTPTQVLRQGNHASLQQWRMAMEYGNWRPNQAILHKCIVEYGLVWSPLSKSALTHSPFPTSSCSGTKISFRVNHSMTHNAGAVSSWHSPNKHVCTQSPFPKQKQHYILHNHGRERHTRVTLE
jgi:hypothetical protein